MDGTRPLRETTACAAIMFLLPACGEERPTVTQDALVLVSNPRLEPMRPLLESQGWRFGRLWDPASFEAQQVRAIIHVGEMALSRDILGRMPRLGLIANIGAGYDGVDVPWCRGHGIEVTHAKGMNADDVADHAIGLLIASWRGIREGDLLVRAANWHADTQPAPPASLQGCRLGIVGLGAIGQAIARRALPFGMSISWWGPNAKDVAWPRHDTVLALAKASDILMVCCRADEANRHLISADIIAALGPQGLLINVARGSLVDEAALIAALRAGRLGRAALDVFAEEPTPAELWRGVPNTLLTPHAAGATSTSIPRMVLQAVQNISHFLAGEPVVSPV
jgi:lactate dehydrogenase-like 2-hydroxyacid dehydrogenase